MENMAEVTQETDEKVTIPLDKEELDNLIAWTATILKEETDNEILRSVFALLHDLRTDVGVREGLKTFLKNGWALIRKSQRPNQDPKLHDSPTSSMMVELQQPKLKPKLESRLMHEIHPLNNELKIFEFSSVNDLKSCRLVCKKWCDLSLSTWRSKAVLKAGELFIQYAANDEDEASQIFLESASKLRQVPFQRYDMYVEHPVFRLSPLSDTEKRTMMLDSFGSSAQLLKIHCDDLDILSMILTEAPELRDLNLRLCHIMFKQYDWITSNGGECSFQNLQPETSKLRKLELDLCPDCLRENINFPWKNFSESFPALKSLRLNHFSFSGITTHVREQIMKSLCEARRDGNFSTLELEELNIFHVSDDVVSRVAESQFPLRSLYIHLGNRNNASTISGLLQACGETLEYIKCGIWSNEECRRLLVEPYVSSKVKLPKLKELVLIVGVAFPNMLCSVDVPNLEELIIEPNNTVQNEQQQIYCGGRGLKSKTFRDSCVFPNLKKFFYKETTCFSEKELRILAKAMPNLTNIAIPLGHKTFSVVCEVWSELQSLHVTATEITYLLLDDYAITGLPVPNYCEDGVHAESRESNITNLKNLQKFVLNTRLDGVRNLLRPRKAWITDFSAVYGFLHLPKLQVLEIETVCKFSPSVMVSLKNQVSELKIREPNIFAFVPANSSDVENDSESSLDESKESPGLDEAIGSD